MRQLTVGALVVLLLLSAATPGRAQSFGTIAGDVKDASGPALPGVTVTVTSPALGNKSRSGVTDSAGHYSIGNLPTGTYSASFGLSGFNTKRQDGIMVAAFAIATVNAELSVWTIPQAATGRPPAAQLPQRTVVCGLTVLQGGSQADPKMAQHLPQGAPKGVIGIMPAPMCQK